MDMVGHSFAGRAVSIDAGNEREERGSWMQQVPEKSML
jgi:hypothetical protein